MNTMTRKEVYVIINPVSGTRSKKDIPRYFSALDATRFNVRLLYTEYAGHATEIAKEAVANKADYVIAVGGDGTINETAKALIHSNTALGIVPLGSGNGLARSLSIPLNIAKAIDVIRAGITRPIDYGTINGHVFLCTCGVGFDAEVSENVSNQSKRGRLMYARTMIDTFRRLKPERYTVVTPSATFETDAFLITCANAPQYGNNAYIAPNAKMDDGQMNIVILKPLSVFDLPALVIQMFTKNIGKNRKMTEIIAPEVTILRENEGVIHLDGDARHAGKEINVRIIRSGLNVLVSPKK